MSANRHLAREYVGLATRRHFLRQCATGLGALWMAEALGTARASAPATPARDLSRPMEQFSPHAAPRARRVIYLHMSGAPSQLDLFDHKPELARLDGKPCPGEYLEGQRFAFITGVPAMLGPRHKFSPSGASGTMVSDLLPHFRKIIDDVCLIKSMQTDQFNHAPAQLLLHTGNANLGYASIGSWVTYGLGTENQNLPGFVVLISGGSQPDAGKAAWGAGFLPSVYQGVQCRSEGDPVLYLSNPRGVTHDVRRRALSAIEEINRRLYEDIGDPETMTRIAQFEMAHRMQLHAHEAMDISREPEHIHRLYGTRPGRESFANNCLLARRLAERGVRYIQLFDWNWDHHGTSEDGSVDVGLKQKCLDVDQAMTALLIDLKQRGMLEDTLVVWGGEFGRTPMRELRAGVDKPFFGRDHHKDAFTIWLAGGGARAGTSYGETDPVGFSVAKDPVHVRDLHATLLHLLGIDHERLSVPFQGLNQKLTGVQKAHVIRGLVA